MLSPPRFFDLLDRIAYYGDKMTVGAAYQYDDATDCFVLPAATRPQVMEVIGKYGIDIAADPFPNDGALCPVSTTLRKIHYGCGPNLFPGWLNVDSGTVRPQGAASAEYQRANLARRHPFADESFDFGYAEDFLEHLSQVDSFTFLAEARRTLANGGVLRLSFPGLEGVLNDHYPSTTIEQVYRGKLTSSSYWDHEHFYSREELTFVAERLGYSDVTFQSYGKSDHAELIGIDTRDQQRDSNTYAEIVK